MEERTLSNKETNTETPVEKENGFKKIWNSLTPAKKRNYITVTIAGLVIATAFAGYKVNRPGKSADTNVPTTGNGRQIVNLDSGLLGKTRERELEKDVFARDTELKEKNAKLKEFELQLAGIQSGAQTPQSTAPNSGLKKVQPFPGPGLKGSQQGQAQAFVPPLPQERASPQSSDQGETPSLKEVPIPPLPGFNKNYPQAPLPSGRSGIGRGEGGPGQYKAEQEIEIGDIAIVSNAPGVAASAAKDDKSKKKEQKIYLPESFMEATLLSGLDAPTAIDGKAQASPTLIRIAAPAVLPNEVKMQLKGCFVIAECTGNLGSERADCRLVSLSCVARDGRAVIDQKIKGFLVDGDGKIGLAGKVVAKMGAMLARSALAGFFGGVGKVFESSSMTTAITGGALVQTPNSEQALKAGFGGGMAQASQDLQKFYLDLGRQTLPVIEVGAAKRVTLVISEGVDLNIKLHCDRKNAFGDVVCQESDERAEGL